MSGTVIGAVTGLALALTWAVFGFWTCLLVAVAMAIGAVVGRVVDGRLDLRAVASALRGRRSSS